MNSIGENFAGNERQCPQLLQEDLLAWVQAEDGQVPELGQAWKIEAAASLVLLVPSQIHLTVMAILFGAHLIIIEGTKHTRYDRGKVLKRITFTRHRREKAACHPSLLCLPHTKHGLEINLTEQDAIEHIRVALVDGQREAWTLMSPIIVAWASVSEREVVIVQALTVTFIKQIRETFTGTTVQENEAGVPS